LLFFAYFCVSGLDNPAVAVPYKNRVRPFILKVLRADRSVTAMDWFRHQAYYGLAARLLRIIGIIADDSMLPILREESVSIFMNSIDSRKFFLHPEGFQGEIALVSHYFLLIKYLECIQKSKEPTFVPMTWIDTNHQ